MQPGFHKAVYTYKTIPGQPEELTLKDSVPLGSRYLLQAGTQHVKTLTHKVTGKVTRVVVGVFQNNKDVGFMPIGHFEVDEALASFSEGMEWLNSTSPEK